MNFSGFEKLGYINNLKIIGNVMKRMWKLSIFECALVVILSGCGEEKPSDKMAADTVHKVAEQDANFGIEIVDFVRENGWVDDQTPNRYKVRFNYNLELIKPYSEIVLDNAKKIRSEMAQNSKGSSGGSFDVNAMQSSLEAMQQSIAVNQWVRNQGENFKPRFEKFVANCTPCTAYVYDKDVSKAEQNLRFQSYISSWGFFEEVGIKDDAVIGSKIPRQASSAFMKTEKGWLPVQ